MKKNDDVKVSVLCLVYNHEKYLRQCLNSMLNQKTSFKYEIIIHDDCSTDNSKKIIEEFEKNNPNKIVAIYEKENQYSKGVRINKTIMIPRIKGKYFCFCEGDDFWTDEDKLQKQYDFMENNPDYKLCVHNSIAVNEKGKEIYKIEPLKTGGELTCNDFIVKGGNFVSTNAIFSYSCYAKNLPDYFDLLSVDYVWQIYLSSQGKSYCFSEYMSAYRVGSSESWTNNINTNVQKHIAFKEKVIKFLKMFNEHTDYQYDKSISETITRQEFAIFELKKDYKSMKNEPYYKIYKSKPIKMKLKYFIDEHFPKLYKIIYKIVKRKGARYE